MRLTLITVWFVTVAAAVPSWAQSDALTHCTARAKTQLALDDCAAQEAARTDSALKDIHDKILSAETDRQAIFKIEAAEKAWILYRDAFLEAMYPAADKRAEYGSSYPMEFALLRAELTQRQVEALGKLYEEHKGR